MIAFPPFISAVGPIVVLFLKDAIIFPNETAIFPFSLVWFLSGSPGIGKSAARNSFRNFWYLLNLALMVRQMANNLGIKESISSFKCTGFDFREVWPLLREHDVALYLLAHFSLISGIPISERMSLLMHVLMEIFVLPSETDIFAGPVPIIVEAVVGGGVLEQILVGLVGFSGKGFFVSVLDVDGRVGLAGCPETVFLVFFPPVLVVRVAEARVRLLVLALCFRAG